MRIPLTCISKKHIMKHNTVDDIMEVLAWSFQQLAAQKTPSCRHDGQPWNQSDSVLRKKPVTDIQLTSVLAELRGDWKMLKDSLRFPGWNEVGGICWRCMCTREGMKDPSATATWRSERCSHWQLVERILAKGDSTSPIFSSPCFRTTCIKVDWLHCVDLGVAADFLGSLLYTVIKKMPGRSEDAKVREMFSEMQDYYRERAGDSRLDSLTKLMLKQPKKAPKLRGRAGEVRGLVDFGVLAAHKHLDASNPNENAAMQASLRLQGMYRNLSGAVFDPESLRANCRQFCLLYSALAEKLPDMWRLKPKMHLLQELCEMQEQPSNPSLYWTYRDEDFGGSIAHISRRRGGMNSPNSTARSMLERFIAQNVVPIL